MFTFFKYYIWNDVLKNILENDRILIWYIRLVKISFGLFFSFNLVVDLILKLLSRLENHSFELIILLSAQFKFENLIVKILDCRYYKSAIIERCLLPGSGSDIIFKIIFIN